ncbi:uncharacterized protein LOC123005947 isoform X1 [Tribolium madens]|uniref:uncharacterized protein LOC123005947 isoform X1 n=1 Tax=Tribolium madens TaxID=41895 RepID=UPI001CF74B82|nr:uncharacterized protein LOC123005947 isoform X1 [Tribolium madens]
MGSATMKKSITDHRIALLLFVSVIFLSIEVTSGALVKNPNLLKKNHCRTHIFSPVCRGQQKRDILSRISDEYRVPTLDSDFSGIDRPRDFASIFNPSLLGELLKKTIESSPEYDPDNSNYLK